MENIFKTKTIDDYANEAIYKIKEINKLTNNLIEYFKTTDDIIAEDCANQLIGKILSPDELKYFWYLVGTTFSYVDYENMVYHKNVNFKG